ncbi:DUF5060 domain-containing protein [Hymenobacter sp. CRA2]|uniref:DUF5060 domain-containing protein n=1 Tax=Hymenobacter sp. CRA2 TaxID=1955620 RepID=UPI00098E930D|nr:DUF5060 domain-containing protein [Hymenobacter sp. CRA2]OON66945.1 hypothetical protein B0919_20395 [Hymenobacter sp. CRA2]
MRPIFLLLLLSWLSAGSAWALRIREVRVLGAAPPARYQKLELGVALNPARFNNPYDPAEIRVTAEFISPEGKGYWVQGFWYQDFKRCQNCPAQRSPQDTCYYCNDCPENPKYLQPVATPLPWRLRFAPPTAGKWRYRVVVMHGDTTISTEPVTVTVAASANPGFVGKHPNNRNFAFADGKVFFPLGLNVTNTWNNGPYNRLPYRDARVGIQRIAEQGGNYARVLLIPAQFGIEGPDGPAGSYDLRQNRAYDFDEVLELAARRGVYLQTVLVTQDELFDSESFGRAWPKHPYYQRLPPGSPNTRFFADSVCRQLLRQRIRYIMARWGYSPALFGVELMGEADCFGAGTNDQFWDRDNPRLLRRWADEMLAYARSLAPQHLYTINVGYAFSGNYPLSDTSAAPYYSPQVDFVQDHYYSSDKNVEYQRAFMARRAAGLYPSKPYFVGEFGLEQNGCWYGSSNFTRKLYPPGLLYHDLNELHNTLWSSAFNGSGGTAMYWWANQVFGLCFGGQYHYLKPLQQFLNACPIFEERYEAVASPCPGDAGPKDAKHEPTSPGNCIPIWTVGREDGANPAFLPTGARTSTPMLEVYALRSPARVVGWVHNRHNYWYKLPHSAGPKENAACNALNDNQPSTPDSIPALVGQQVTIERRVRPGRYRLEFFSTYPFYDVNRDGKKDQGGVIPQFTTEVRASADSALTFTVPPLRPLGTAPYAPDYGFKATWLPEAAPKPASAAPRKPSTATRRAATASRKATPAAQKKGSSSPPKRPAGRKK